MKHNGKKLLVFVLFFLLIFGNSFSSIAAISETPVGEQEGQMLQEPTPTKDPPPLKEDIGENPPGDDGGDYNEECHVIKLVKVMNGDKAGFLGITEFQFEVTGTSSRGQDIYEIITVPINGGPVSLDDWGGVELTIKEIIPIELASLGLEITSVTKGSSPHPFSGDTFVVTVPSGYTTITVENDIPLGSMTVFKTFDDIDFSNETFQVTATGQTHGEVYVFDLEHSAYIDTEPFVYYDTYDLVETNVPEDFGFDGFFDEFDNEITQVTINDNSPAVRVEVNNFSTQKVKFKKHIDGENVPSDLDFEFRITLDPDPDSVSPIVLNSANGFEKEVTLRYGIYTISEEIIAPPGSQASEYVFENFYEEHFVQFDDQEQVWKMDVNHDSPNMEVIVNNKTNNCPVTFIKKIDDMDPGDINQSFTINLSGGPVAIDPIVLDNTSSPPFTKEVELPYGTYTLSEGSMPTSLHDFVDFQGDGVSKPVDDYILTVEEGLLPETTVIVNNQHLPKIKVYKYIMNARYDSNDAEFDVQLTDEGSKTITTLMGAEFNHLEYDKEYTLEEIALETGYTFEKIVEITGSDMIGTDQEALDATAFTGPIVLTENLQERSFVVINDREPTGKVTVRKLLSDRMEQIRESDRVKGFDVKLYKGTDNTGELIDTLVITEDGTEAVFDNLSDGTYTLIETEAMNNWYIESYTYSGEGGVTSGFAAGPNGITFEIGEVDVDGLLRPIDEIVVEVTNFREPAGKIIVHKEIDNYDSDHEFTVMFSDESAQGPYWQLLDDKISEVKSLTFDGLLDGTYYIVEDGKTGYEFVKYQQTVPLDPNFVDTRGNGIAVTITEDVQEVEVTITNTKLDDPVGGLRIIKRVIYMDGDERIEVLDDATEFDVGVGIIDGGPPWPGQISVIDPWFMPNLIYSFFGQIYEYSIFELDLPPGYAFLDIYELVPLDGGGYEERSILEDRENRTGILASLREGDVVEVIIENEILDPRGRVTLTKSVINENGSARSSDNGTFVLALSGPNDFYQEVTIVGNGSKTIEDLEFGDYTVSEVSRSSSRYSLVSISPETFTVDIFNRVHVSTVTNRYTPPDDPPEDPDPTRLRIYKDVVDNEDAGDFTFILNGPDYDDEEITLGDGDRFSRSVDAGTYTIQELLQDDYAVEVTVNGRDVEIGDDGSVEVDVDDEETVEVRFTNTYIPPEEPPEAPPEEPPAPPEPEPDPPVIEEGEPEIILEDIVPLGINTLPQTGNVPPEVFYALGSIIAGLGYSIRKKYK